MVKPPGQLGLTRRRLAAGGSKRGGGRGIATPAPNRAAEGTRGKLGLACIHWCPPFHRRRPKSTAATTWAAAGVRARAGSACGARGGRGEGGFYGGAHSESNGVVGELGEGLGQPERRRRSRRPKLEDDGDGDEAELARVALLGEEGEGVAAELGSVSGRCGSGLGHGGYGWRRR